MEIGDQQVNGAKAVSRRDKDIRLPLKGMDHPLFIGRAFQKPQTGRPDRDETSAIGPYRIHLCRRRRGDKAAFRMHPVIVRIGHLHRQESPRPHMQCRHDGFNAAGPEGRHQFFGEMQSCRRRRHRPFIFRKDRLIIAAVLLIHGALAADIGWQGNLPHLHQLFHQFRPPVREGERHLAAREFF